MSGAGSVMALLDREIRSYLYSTSITNPVSRADTSSDPRQPRRLENSAITSFSVPPPFRPMSRGRVCHRVTRTGTARHAGIRVALLPRTGPSQRTPRRLPTGRGGRVRRRDVVGPLLPLERPAGPLGVRVVVARRRPAVDVAAVRHRQRSRPALPPRDHRPGDLHPHRDVPRPLLGGAGHGRGQQRAHHRRRLAPQGRARRPPARVRRHHPRPAPRRGGEPRRAGQGRPRDASTAGLPNRHRSSAPRSARRRPRGARSGRTG